jgi:protein-S-isoprenylcysteine O-methyltransferase Ste14
MANTIKTVFYMGSLHGFFTFYLPYQLASRDTRFFQPGLLGYLALLFWILGVWIIVQCSADIIRRGRGTPAFIDPPKELLVTGLYRHIRNPIYLGALIVQMGYIIWFGSAWAVLYALLMFLGFNVLVFFIEEPILRNTFGAGYEEYCQNVPRWIPKIK